jgi:hypothetical protein
MSSRANSNFLPKMRNQEPVKKQVVLGNIF